MGKKASLHCKLISDYLRFSIFDKWVTLQHSSFYSSGGNRVNPFHLFGGHSNHLVSLLLENGQPEDIYLISGSPIIILQNLWKLSSTVRSKTLWQLEEAFWSRRCFYWQLSSTSKNTLFCWVKASNSTCSSNKLCTCKVFVVKNNTESSFLCHTFYHEKTNICLLFSAVHTEAVKLKQIKINVFKLVPYVDRKYLT